LNGKRRPVFHLVPFPARAQHGATIPLAIASTPHTSSTHSYKDIRSIDFYPLPIVGKEPIRRLPALSAAAVVVLHDPVRSFLLVSWDPRRCAAGSRNAARTGRRYRFCCYCYCYCYGRRLPHQHHRGPLELRGVGPSNPVGDFYGGGGGGPAQDYGIFFGSNAAGAVDNDAVGDVPGSVPIANEPSPSTVLNVFGGSENQAYMTVAGGFTTLSFQYTSIVDVDITLYDGPNRTGNVLGVATLPAVGYCQVECGDPAGSLGVWKNFTVPPIFFSGGGLARSVGFSTSAAFVLIDDMVITLALPKPPPTTKRPTTKRPSAKRPAANACAKGMKGGSSNNNVKRCRMMMMKPKAA
jgi:hypothetical protein